MEKIDTTHTSMTQYNEAFIIMMKKTVEKFYSQVCISK